MNGENDLDLSGIVYPEKGTPKYDIRALYEYCIANNISLPLPEDSPILEMFRIGTY